MGQQVRLEDQRRLYRSGAAEHAAHAQAFEGGRMQENIDAALA
jgi:hypothetical protein